MTSKFKFLTLSSHVQTEPKSPTLEQLISSNKEDANTTFNFIESFIKKNEMLTFMNSRGYLHVDVKENRIEFSATPTAFLISAKKFPDYDFWPKEDSQ